MDELGESVRVMGLGVAKWARQLFALLDESTVLGGGLTFLGLQKGVMSGVWYGLSRRAWSIDAQYNDS